MGGIWETFYKHSGKILGSASGIVAVVLAAPVIKGVVTAVIASSPIIQVAIAIGTAVAVVSGIVTVKKYNNSTEHAKDSLEKAEDDIESARTESQAKLEADLEVFKQKTKELENKEKERVTEISKLEGEKAAAETRLTTQKKLNLAKGYKLTSAVKKLQLACDEIARKDEELITTRQKLDKVQESQESLEGKVREIMRELSANKVTIQELAEDKDQAIANENKYKSALIKAQEDIEGRDEQITDLKQKIVEATAQTTPKAVPTKISDKSPPSSSSKKLADDLLSVFTEEDEFDTGETFTSFRK